MRSGVSVFYLLIMSLIRGNSISWRSIECSSHVNYQNIVLTDGRKQFALLCKIQSRGRVFTIVRGTYTVSHKNTQSSHHNLVKSWSIFKIRPLSDF